MPIPIIEICSTTTRDKQYQLEGLNNFTLYEQQHLAIVGANGSGKSILVGILTGKYPLVGNGIKYHFGNNGEQYAYKQLKYISFRDSYGSAEDQEYYYQQRWNSSDVEGRARVLDALGTYEHSAFQQDLFHIFSIEAMLHKQMILLSSGEMRKFQLVKALLSMPRVLIIDNPFIGLDMASRDLLRGLLQNLAQQQLVQIVLVLSRPSEIPDFITHVLPMAHRTCDTIVPRADFTYNNDPIDAALEQSKILLHELERKTHEPCEVVSMHNLNIKYGVHSILSDINLCIQSGETWALLGENGSGKSTLLSLICADNPQSYACDMTLFGKKRGSGESIWDIKRRIGYVSPEMQRSYQKPLPAIDIVASGLFDTIGLYKKVHEVHREVSMQWMRIFGVAHLAERVFTSLSSGEQRLVLLARAFVKNPDLIILDEPLHGLDDTNRHLVRGIVEAFTSLPEKTAIIVSHYPEELPKSVSHYLRLPKRKA